MSRRPPKLGPARDRDAHGRHLPHHEEAEAAILGGVMLQNEALGLLDSLEVEDFYNPRHRVVFTAMRNLEAVSAPVDVVTLEREIQKSGKLDAIGGVAFLGELTLRVPTVDNVEQYAKIVHERRITRDVMQLLSNLIDEAYHGHIEGEQLVSDITNALLTIRTGHEHPIVTMAQLITEEAQSLIRDMEAKANGQHVMVGIPTGITLVDEKIGGHPLALQTLYIARPGNGKTTIAMHLARAANEAGEPSLLATYEDRGQSFGQRGLAQETGLVTELIRARRVRAEDLGKVTAGYVASGRRDEGLLVAAGLSAEALVRRVRRANLKRKQLGQKPYRQVLVDYLQKMPYPEWAKSDDQALTHISRVLGQYAVEDNAAMVMFSQLNRDLEKRDDHRPRISDIRGSGSLEQDGKTIFALYRPHLYEPGKVDPNTGEKWRPEDLIVICLKNAQGESGFDVPMWWDLKSHAMHNTALDQGARALARPAAPAAVDFGKRTKKAKAPQPGFERFDDAPPPEPDEHGR